MGTPSPTWEHGKRSGFEVRNLGPMLALSLSGEHLWWDSAIDDTRSRAVPVMEVEVDGMLVAWQQGLPTQSKAVGFPLVAVPQDFEEEVQQHEAPFPSTTAGPHL